MPASSELGPLSATVTALRSAGCVFAEEEARLLLAHAGTPAELADLVRRRAAGQPLEVLLGWAEFCGLRVAVDAGVFVPRRRTGFLVEQAVARARPGAVVLDLCCGTGALGLAMATALGRLELHAADLDPVALRCAAVNLAPVGGRVYAGDLYDALPEELRGRIEVIVANAPYVPTGALEFLPPEARDHEPRLALDGGPDGVEVHRRVAAGAPRWLAPGGSLLIETGEEQAVHTAAAMSAAGLIARTVHSEEWACTVVAGELSAAGARADPAVRSRPFSGAE
jgi:release factor glutamine methyltransferase